MFFRRNALQAVLFQKGFDPEALETNLAGKRSLSAVNSSMFDESNGFFESTEANIALVGG